MRVSDWIVSYLYDAGVKDVFLLTGGGMMFLTDALACHEKIRKICCHHEQAAAMAAVSYAKYRGLGACFVTTGCGGTNTVTGVLHAWQDSTPCVFISGECNRDQTIASRPTKIRQLGPQEADMPPIVESITKYAVTIDDPALTAYHLEKALYLATHGRPGPVWLSVPMDVQEAEIGDGAALRRFTPQNGAGGALENWEADAEKAVRMLREAKRPVVLAGHGVRLSGMNDVLTEIVRRARIPLTVTKLGLDYMPHQDGLYMGMAGTRGTRSGNFAIQRSDVLLVLGSRLAPTMTGYNYDLFAPDAAIIAVDIDAEEHGKGTVKIDRLIHADLKRFLPYLKDRDLGDHSEWADMCAGWKEKVALITPDRFEDADGVSMYAFIDLLNKHLEDRDVVVTDSGQTSVVTPQAIALNGKYQRFICGGAQGEMGFAVPGAIGAQAGCGGRVICVTGDGSFQLNLQELQTIVHHQMPVKLFVWNNGGYMSIRGHQKSVFHERYLGVGAQSGVSFPDLEKLGGAYGIPYYRGGSIRELRIALPEIMGRQGPALCEVLCKFEEPVVGSVSTKRLPDGRRISMSLEDMFPFIDRDLYREIMEK